MFRPGSGEELPVPVQLHKTGVFDPEEPEDAVRGPEPDLARDKSRSRKMAELLDRFMALRLHLPGCAPEMPGPLDPDDAEPVGSKEHVIAVECRFVREKKKIAPLAQQGLASLGDEIYSANVFIAISKQL